MIFIFNVELFVNFKIYSILWCTFCRTLALPGRTNVYQRFGRRPNVILSSIHPKMFYREERKSEIWPRLSPLIALNRLRSKRSKMS